MKNAIVIITVTSPLNFGNNKAHINRSYYDLYYNFLPKKYIKGYSWIRKIYLKLPLLLHPQKIKKLVKDDAPISPLSSDCFLNEAEMNKNKEQLFNGWYTNFNLKNLKDASQSKEHVGSFIEKQRVLRDILDLCKEQGWHPVMVIPPMAPCVIENISEEFKNEFVLKNIDAVNKENFLVLDYSCDDRFKDSKFYLSAAFMNKNGRRLFTSIVKNDIDMIINDRSVNQSNVKI